MTHSDRTELLRLQLAARAAGLGTWEWDLQTGRTCWSASTYALFDRRPDEAPLTIERFLHLVHPEDRSRIAGEIEEVVASKRDFSGEYRIVLPDGSERFHAASGSVLRDDSGRATHVMGACWDITSRCLVERALRASEAKCRALVENLPDVILCFDERFRYTYVSPSVRRVVPMTAADFLGRTHRELGFPSEQCDFQERTLAAVFASGRSRETEFTLCNPLGTFVFNWRLVPQADDDGMVTGVMTIGRDITEHRRTEENYRALFTSMVDGHALFDVVTDASGEPIDYRLVAANPAFERMTGLSAAEVVGKRVLEIVPNAGVRWLEEFARVATTGRWVHFEEYAETFDRYVAVTAYRPRPGQVAISFMDITDRRRAREQVASLARLAAENPEPLLRLGADGVVQDANNAATPLLKAFRTPTGTPATGPLAAHAREATASGRRVQVEMAADRRSYRMTFVPVPENGYVNVYGHDVTDRKQTEDQLRQAQKMEAIGRLAGGIAHDFNNLLAPILGYAEMLLTATADDDGRRSDLEEIVRAAGRAKDLTRQLLAFGRKQVLSMRAVDLNAVVAGAERLLRRLVREDIALRVEAAEGPCPVHADAGQIEQVLMNLVINAADAIGRDGTITIATAARNLTPEDIPAHWRIGPGACVVLSVRDTGAGMDAPTQARVFEPFFTTKEADKGTGLGLSTVLGIVEQHGGAIAVDSAPAAGSTFTVYLPHGNGTADAAPAPDPADADTIGPEGGRTILVVEDDPAVRKLTCTVLAGRGYRLLQAAAPGEAIALARRHGREIDLLLTDVIMPEMNGPELREQLRPLCPDLRVVFMSGYAEDVIARRGPLDRQAHFLQKPFMVDALATQVRHVLGGEPA
ncbi:MAG: PAS domain-containing protein [Planctomycetota bacterium]